MRSIRIERKGDQLYLSVSGTNIKTKSLYEIEQQDLDNFFSSHIGLFRSFECRRINLKHEFIPEVKISSAIPTLFVCSHCGEVVQVVKTDSSSSSKVNEQEETRRTEQPEWGPPSYPAQKRLGRQQSPSDSSRIHENNSTKQASKRDSDKDLRKSIRGRLAVFLGLLTDK